MAFLESIHLARNTAYARRDTRRNGMVLPRETRNTQLSQEASHYANGMELEIVGDGNYVLTSWTVEDSKHVRSFRMKVSPTGKLINGWVNCFALGWMKADDDYLNQVIEEFDDSVGGWDVIDYGTELT